MRKTLGNPPPGRGLHSMALRSGQSESTEHGVDEPLLDGVALTSPNRALVGVFQALERETGLEPATLCLGSRCSTN